MVSIDRAGHASTMRKMITDVKKKLDSGSTIIIFPEGTRSRDGQPKSFSINGLKVLTKYNKDSYIVPLTINNSWQIFKYGKYPVGVFSPITIITHKPIKINSLPFDELLAQTEKVIKEHIN